MDKDRNKDRNKSYMAYGYPLNITPIISALHYLQVCDNLIKTDDTITQ